MDVAHSVSVATATQRTACHPHGKLTCKGTARPAPTEKLSKADWSGVERHCQGGSSKKAREGISSQSSRDGNDTNEVEH